MKKFFGYIFTLGFLVISTDFAQQEQAPDANRTSCEVSPKQMMGPFYPIHEQGDKDVNLTRIKNTSPARIGEQEGIAEGEIIYVKGQVLDERCQPVFGAAVEIWQANSKGKYTHERDFNPAL